MLLANSSAVALFAIGLLLMVIILMRRLRRLTRRSRRANPHRAVKQVRLDADRQLEQRRVPLIDGPKEANRWTTEMHEIARDTRAEIDTKIRLLQATMREAAQQAQRLEELIRRAETFQLGSDEAVVEEIDRIATALDEARIAAVPRADSHQADGNESDFPESLREEVCELMRTGLSAHYVANQTGIAVGDVELILSLAEEQP